MVAKLAGLATHAGRSLFSRALFGRNHNGPSGFAPALEVARRAESVLSFSQNMKYLTGTVVLIFTMMKLA